MKIAKARYANQRILGEKIRAARGETAADLVIKNVQFLDVFSGKFVQGDVAVHGETVVGVMDEYRGVTEIDGSGQFLVPGFIDSHVHIESSMMTPVRFQESVLPCGTTTVIWDPHEIANVKGQEGIKWALAASEGLQLDVFVMVPSCVPSTTPKMELETSGADLRAADLRDFRQHPRVLGLAEMMNFPGLLFGDDDVHSKIQDFNSMRRDGHCPGLSGKDLNAYGVAGIHSCHESTTTAEAAEKLSKGIHVLIREGSCAKDAETLLPLVNAYTSATIGLCSDDRNPLDIEEQGHLNCILNLALRMGIAPEHAFRVASFAAARAYGLDDRGAIAPGYQADLVLIERQGADWRQGFKVQQVLKSGRLVKAADLTDAQSSVGLSGKNLNLPEPSASQLTVHAPAQGKASVRVIGVRPRQIVTDSLQLSLPVVNGQIQASPEQDVLKIAVFERHHRTGRSSVAFVQGFGLREGAIATSINHDSHNIIAVGANDAAMLRAVRELMRIDGGIVVAGASDELLSLPLPLGGLMTDASPQLVAAKLKQLKALTRQLGCALEEPFLTLSFLALPVIPSLKITDRGLVDVTRFQLVPVSL
jgi:adenine deaminase